MNTLYDARPYTVIMSAWNEALTLEDNLCRHAMLKQDLHDNGVCSYDAVGCYMGQCEQSLVIKTHSEFCIDICKQLARVYNQECILIAISGQDMKAQVNLYYSPEKIVHIGEGLVHVPHCEAVEHESYTILNGNEYWVVK
jgi:hypothetical protein